MEFYKMRDMHQSNRRAIITIGFVITVFTIWFIWMAFAQAKAQRIESKVQQAMSTSMESLAPQWPRIEIRNSLAGKSYYTPIINDPLRNFELTRHILGVLNQDMSVPPVKVTQVSLRADYQSNEDTLTCEAYVLFPLFAGINREVMVQSAIQIPHYRTLR